MLVHLAPDPTAPHIPSTVKAAGRLKQAVVFLGAKAGGISFTQQMGGCSTLGREEGSLPTVTRDLEPTGKASPAWLPNLTATLLPTHLFPGPSSTRFILEDEPFADVAAFSSLFFLSASIFL